MRGMKKEKRKEKYKMNREGKKGDVRKIESEREKQERMTERKQETRAEER
jgi:hypothetical protein